MSKIYATRTSIRYDRSFTSCYGEGLEAKSFFKWPKIMIDLFPETKEVLGKFGIIGFIFRRSCQEKKDYQFSVLTKNLNGISCIMTFPTESFLNLTTDVSVG